MNAFYTGETAPEPTPCEPHWLVLEVASKLPPIEFTKEVVNECERGTACSVQLIGQEDGNFTYMIELYKCGWDKTEAIHIVQLNPNIELIWPH